MAAAESAAAESAAASPPSQRFARRQGYEQSHD
jgi:hypothetical protein